MQSGDAVEIVRASLALAFPGASAEGLSKASELVVRWGAEGVAEHLDQALTRRMLQDLLGVTGAPRVERADPEWERGSPPANYRTWSRPEQTADDVPFRHRPPDGDDGEPPPRRGPGSPAPSA